MRTFFTIVLLGLSLGLALIMLTVNGAIQNQMEEVKSKIGNDITVRPAGSFAGWGGGETIQDADIEKILTLPHITSVQKTAETFYSGDSLESSINAGRLGRQTNKWIKEQFSKMPVIVMGFETSNTAPKLIGGGQAEITEGRYFFLNESDANVALLGQALATKNAIDIGSVIDINGYNVKIIGIFTSGQVFGDSVLIVPFNQINRYFDLSGTTALVVEADNVDKVNLVADSIRQTLGADKVDVLTSEETYEKIRASMANFSQTSEIGMIASFVVAAAIILFSVFLSVRQRIKEIGILKAIGASNFNVGLQFGLESLQISIVAAILGSFFAFLLINRIESLLNSSRQADPLLFVYALSVATGLAVLASLFSSWFIGRVKPAEVLRNE